MATPDTTSPSQPPAFGPLADWGLLIMVALLLGIPSSMLLWRMAFSSGERINQATGEIVPPLHPSLSQTAEALTITKPDGERDGPKPKSLLRTYVPQHFGFKDDLVDIAAVAQVEWLGVSSTPRVLLGQNGWLYIKDPPETVDELRGTAPLAPHQIDAIVATWQFYAHEFASQGVPFAIAITPDKPSLVPEHLPPWLKARLQKRRAEQVLAHVQAIAPDLPVIDLRPAVRALQASGVQTFQKTDTHWTDQGAFAGYQALMDWVAARVPTARMLELEDLQPIHEDRAHGGDLANFLGMSERMPEALERLVVREARGMATIEEGKQRFRREGGTSEANEPTLVMYRDSFAHRLEPFLDESFGRTVYLWPSAAGQPQGAIDIAAVMAEHPDVVIFELTERWFTIKPDAIGVFDRATVEAHLGSGDR